MRKATILVIEDEEKQRRVVGLHLASAGYEVKAAGTAEEGLKLAGDVDLILTDLKLPGMDGLALLEKLECAELARAGDRDVGVRHGRERGRSHEERRGRFSAQAVFARSPERGGGKGAGSPQAAR